MSIAPTSDGEARPNEMTVHQWLDYVIDSDRVTRVTQHLALLVFALAVRQQKNGVSASLRDLERMTGWSKSMIADHLDELKDAIHMTAGVGRRKSIFELQSLIADAVKDIASPVVVSANARTLEQDSVRQCADATADAIPDASSVRPKTDAIPDATPSVPQCADAIPDATPESAKKVSPHTPLQRKQNTHTQPGADASVHVCPAGPGFTQLGHGAWLNCEKIWHPKFTISLPAVEMQLALSVDTQSLDCATVCKSAALQWAAAIEGGQNPKEVLPQNIVGAIVGGARRGVYSGLEHKARVAATGGRKPWKPSRW